MIPHLTLNQFDLIRKVISVLKPIDDVTQSCISVVIPFVQAFCRNLKNHDDDQGSAPHSSSKPPHHQFQTQL